MDFQYDDADNNTTTTTAYDATTSKRKRAKNQDVKVRTRTDTFWAMAPQKSAEHFEKNLCGKKHCS